MAMVETFGIVIDVKKNEKSDGISSIDVFTPDSGIVRWFNKSPSGVPLDCTFEEVEITGNRTTETAGNFYGIKILSNNATAMVKNGSYDHAKTFVETLRSVVFDGVPLENLFAITRRTIGNFAAEFDANVVLLKALYLLCREEGYAVDVLWMASLTDSDKIFAKEVILSKFGHSDNDRAASLTRSLRLWILSL
jgi:hypothetical protein